MDKTLSSHIGPILGAEQAMSCSSLMEISLITGPSQMPLVV